MLWLYAWTAAPYVIQIATHCLSDIWNGRASVPACAQRLGGLALQFPCIPDSRAPKAHTKIETAIDVGVDIFT